MKKKIKYFFKKRKSEKRKKLLGPYAKGVIYETENGIISLPVEDTGIGKNLGFKGHWDIAEIKMLEKEIKEDDKIYIIGTHVGTLLVPLAQKCSKVIGFEANENTFWFVKMNLCLNKLNNVKLFQKAVGDENKTVTFYQNTVNSGGSKIKPKQDSILYTYDNPDEVEVEMVALDGFIEKHSLPSPNGMIMDIEGAEFFALQGMQETLKQLRFLYIEFVPHHLLNVSQVTVGEFIDVIVPHFKHAYFVRTNRKINEISNGTQLLSYCEKLISENRADDIIFTN